MTATPRQSDTESEFPLEHDLPQVHVYPGEDRIFKADVVAALARSRATISATRELLDAVRRDLRDRYPRVQIHEQERLASLGDQPLRWYVYRDGKIA